MIFLGLLLLLMQPSFYMFISSAETLQDDLISTHHLARRGNGLFDQDPPPRKADAPGLRLTRQLAIPRHDTNNHGGPPTAHSDPGPLDQIGASRTSNTALETHSGAFISPQYRLSSHESNPAVQKLFAEWHENPDRGIERLIDADWHAYERARNEPRTTRLAAGRHHDRHAFQTAYTWAYYAAHDRHAKDPRPRDLQAVQRLRVAAAARVKRDDIVDSVWTNQKEILKRRFGSAPQPGWTTGTFREACARAFERLRPNRIPPPARVEPYFRTSEFNALLHARDLLAPEINPHFVAHQSLSPPQRRLLEAALKERVRQLSLEQKHGPLGRTWGEAERARPGYGGEDWRHLAGPPASRASSVGSSSRAWHSV